jgi:hypothetical protein
MPIAQGTNKRVAYKRETSFGVLPGATGAKQLRRVTAAFNLEKEEYSSNEIRTDKQVADSRHGVRSATGSVNGELSSAAYADFMGSLLGRDFTTTANITGLTVTIAAGTAPAWTVARSTGSWVNAVSIGQVIRLSGGTLDAANAGKNLLITNVTALILTVVTLDGSALVAQSAVASVTATLQGKTTTVPATNHTDDSYAIEEWFADIAQSEVYTGMKVNNMTVQLPASGLATVDFGFTGKDLGSKGTTAYYTSPTAQGTDGIYAAVNGVVLFNGAPVAVITSADFTVEKATENATVVGSNSVQEIFTGRVRANGNLSVYFTDAAFRNVFDNETPVSLVFAFTESNAPGAKFVSFTLPKVKFNSFSKDDQELGLVASTSFVALLNDVTTNGLPATTIQIQDSQA